MRTATNTNLVREVLDWMLLVGLLLSLLGIWLFTNNRQALAACASKGGVRVATTAYHRICIDSKVVIR